MTPDRVLAALVATVAVITGLTVWATIAVVKRGGR